MLALLPDLAATRERTLALVAHLGDADLERQLHPLMSPLVWDLGHIAAYEDLWLNHRHAGEPLLRPDLAATYDAFETPRSVRGRAALLDAPAVRMHLDAVRARTMRNLERLGPDPVLHELVVRHELQHTETMRQALRLGGLERPEDAALPGPLEDAEDGWADVPGGVVEVGRGPDGFAHDNERPRHPVRLQRYAVARRPLTCAEWTAFAAAGGYRRREWWTPEGWAWREANGVEDCAWARAADPSAPLCHVSCHEAEAIACSLGGRLPTEAEWEHAAASGVLGEVGRVWEWTATPFAGYPGFRPHPYREYSAPFFDGAHRVLRGGSWATASRVASPTFRNWDLPERRQLFAGLRLAG